MKARRRRDLPRSNIKDVEKRLARKRHQAEEALTGGLVEIPGPLPPGLEDEIRNIATSMEEQEARQKQPGASVVAFTPFSRGIAIETRGEKLAQHIADAIARSRHARIERTYDDEGRRRILTCHLPGVGKG